MAAYFGVTLGCTFAVLVNSNAYAKYLQAEIDVEVYSWLTTCTIERIISRPQYTPNSSLTFVNSTFLVSYERTTGVNSERQVFEEWSVPVPLQPNMVSSLLHLDVDSPFVCL